MLRLEIWQHNTHKIDLEKHELSTPIYRSMGRSLLTKNDREIQMLLCLKLGAN